MKLVFFFTQTVGSLLSVAIIFAVVALGISDLAIDFLCGSWVWLFFDVFSSGVIAVIRGAFFLLLWIM